MIFHQPFNSLSGNKYNACFYTKQNFEFHFHKNIEIIYVLEGAINCNINSRSGTLKKGEFGICLPYDIHSYTPKPDSRYWVAVFSEDQVHAFGKLIKGKEGKAFKFCCSESVKNYVSENLINSQDPSLFTLKSGLYALCGEYLESVELVEKNTGKMQMMAEITEFISNHHSENIGLSDIAGLLGYDYHYVSRYFHNTFNMPFKDFLNSYRLETALELLEAGDKKLLDIAYESGFQSVRTFNSCFRKHFGMSPSEYKKSYSI
ncbi:MAG: helix-turn-helix transcriptional regulator [Clostridia bacterium]|nr:helix-turn-helix transcriptional regulator [Clostridia bacterium]